MKARWPAVFISDVHIGARGAQLDRLIVWLDANPCERLYIVGDLFDGLHAVRLPDLLEVLNRIAQAPEVIFVPGNHDAGFRSYFGNFGRVKIVDGAVHVARDGRRYLILHGDEFDAHMGSEFLDTFGATLNSFARRIARASGAGSLDRLIDRTTRALNALATRGALDRRLVGLCAVGEFDGVITGHFHAPSLREIAPGLTAADCGDWIRHCSAIVETDSGELALHFSN